jgi:hypothetical protein
MPGFATLREAICLTGCRPVVLESPSHTIFIGHADLSAKPGDVIVHSDGWRGGVSDVENPAAFRIGDRDDFALGGVFAGAAAVHRCFVRAMEIPAQCLDGPFGISLWDPLSDWLNPIGGKYLRNIPARFWLLGLGHLGQAFLWNLALLPHPKREEVEFLLNDFDLIDTSNFGSGVLCLPGAVGKKKTRHCADWLERWGFKTTLNERCFGANTLRSGDEPRVAFCGFDRAAPRVHLDRAGFDLVIECGLGASLADFDQADLHVFPNTRKSSAELWSGYRDSNFAVSPAVAALFGGADEVCGQLAIDVAGKSVSTSFVGLMSGALAVSELLRTFNRGPVFDSISFNARCREDWDFTEATRHFTAIELAKMVCASLV